MPRQTKAFLLLLLLVTAAGSLALFIHDWNERITKPFTPGVEEKPVPNAPAIVVIYAPTSTPPLSNGGAGSASTSIETFVSADHVTTVTLDFDSAAILPSPFAFHGTTTAFENQASWKLTQKNGKELASGSYYVYSPDSGIPGSFNVTVTSTKTATMASGTLMIYEASAKDGEPIHAVQIPVRLK